MLFNSRRELLTKREHSHARGYFHQKPTPRAPQTGARHPAPPGLAAARSRVGYPRNGPRRQGWFWSAICAHPGPGPRPHRHDLRRADRCWYQPSGLDCDRDHGRPQRRYAPVWPVMARPARTARCVPGLAAAPDARLARKRHEKHRQHSCRWPGPEPVGRWVRTVTFGPPHGLPRHRSPCRARAAPECATSAHNRAEKPAFEHRVQRLRKRRCAAPPLPASRPRSRV